MDVVPAPTPAGPHETPEGRVELARSISAALSYTPISGPTEDEYVRNWARDDLRVDAEKWLTKEYGSVEEATTALGSAIASRAEELAGVDPQAVRDRYLERRAAAESAMEEAQAAYEAPLSEARAAYDHAVDRYETARQEFESYRTVPIARQDLSKFAGLRDAHRVAQSEKEQAEAAYYAIVNSEEMTELRSRYEQASSAYRAADSDPEIREALSRLADGYRQALSETREMGGKHTWHPSSAPAAARVFDEAVQVFPADWVETSSKSGTELLVRHSSRRAHYSYGKERKIYEQFEDVHTWKTRTADGAGLPPGASPENTTPRLHVTRVGEPDDVDQFGVRAGEYTWKVAHFEVHRSAWGSTEDEIRENKPRGNRWRLHEYTDEHGQQRVCWRRPVVKKKQVRTERVAELTTNGGGRSMAGKDSEYVTAVHELSHRFEDRVGGITQLEEDFLTRRTTDPETGEREGLVELYPSSGRKARVISGEGGLPKTGEWARRDELLDQYMGKEYDGKAREVMSTGTEALFGGEFGGLVGLDRKGRADLDMRAFVLGTMASAHRSDRWDADPPVRSTRDMGADLAGQRREQAKSDVARIRERLIRAGLDPDALD